MNEGFLGSAAPMAADLALLLEIGMGVVLLIGAWLARIGRYRQHGWCQSGILLINLVVVMLVMVPTFHDKVAPKIPSKLGHGYYAVATAHAALGSLAEAAGLYIVLAAGTKLLPERFRIKRYKLWMRIVLAIWWSALILGLATYARWYAPQM